MGNFNKSEVNLLSAIEIDEKLLSNYYRNTFPHRKNSLPQIWKWLNNSGFYKNEIPFILKYNDEIIGHTGLRPVTVQINEKNYLSGWPIDLRVDPRFRNQGLGQQLTNKLVDYADIHLAFPNDNSYPLFIKLGWKDGGKTLTHFFPIKPLDHPRFIKKVPAPFRYIINSLAKPYFNFKYSRIGNFKFQIEKITPAALNEFEIQRKLNDDIFKVKGYILPLKDKEYMKWRILDSPNFNKYKMFSVKGVYAIILLNDNRGKYVDILAISTFQKLNQVIDLIASICSYAAKNNYSYVRICSSYEKLSDLLQTKIGCRRKEYRFCFFTKDKDLYSKVQKYRWFWELIDSDFEYMEFNNI